MNTYINLVCFLAVFGLSHGNPIGLGGLGGLGGLSGLGYAGGLVSPYISAPILAPAAVSTANLVKAAPIPVVKTIATPIITAPISIGYGLGGNVLSGLGGVGLGGVGLGGVGLGGVGLGGVGLGGVGLGGLGLSGVGLGGWGGLGKGGVKVIG